VGRYTGGGGYLPIFDPATVAWESAVIANGGSVSAGRKVTVDVLIKGLKTDAVWAKLDRLWIFAAENTPSALTDMVADALAVANGSPSFTTDRGYTGVDGSTTVYVDTGFNPTTAPTPNFVLNSAHVSAWSNTNITPSTGGALLGLSATGGSTNSTSIIPKDAAGNANFRINDTTPSAGVVNANSTGHYLANRSGASASQGYKNGSSVITPNQTSGALVNASIAFLADNDTTNGIFFGGPFQCTMGSIGGNLSSTDVTKFYNRLRTYMTAVGVP